MRGVGRQRLIECDDATECGSGVGGIGRAIRFQAIACHGNPTGVEWDRDLSNDKHRQWVIDQLQREFFLTEDQAKSSLRELIRDLQQERDQVEALDGDLSEKESKPEMSARFPGLVDLVEQDGEVRFLIIQDDGPFLLPPPFPT